jgi:hypothetical protein
MDKLTLALSALPPEILSALTQLTPQEIADRVGKAQSASTSNHSAASGQLEQAQSAAAPAGTGHTRPTSSTPRPANAVVRPQSRRATPVVEHPTRDGSFPPAFDSVASAAAAAVVMPYPLPTVSSASQIRPSGTTRQLFSMNVLLTHIHVDSRTHFPIEKQLPFKLDRVQAEPLHRLLSGPVRSSVLSGADIVLNPTQETPTIKAFGGGSERSPNGVSLFAVVDSVLSARLHARLAHEAANCPDPAALALLLIRTQDPSPSIIAAVQNLFDQNYRRQPASPTLGEDPDYHVEPPHLSSINAFSCMSAVEPWKDLPTEVEFICDRRLHFLKKSEGKVIGYHISCTVTTPSPLSVLAPVAQPCSPVWSVCPRAEAEPRDLASVRDFMLSVWISLLEFVVRGIPNASAEQRFEAALYIEVLLESDGIFSPHVVLERLIEHDNGAMAALILPVLNLLVFLGDAAHDFSSRILGRTMDCTFLDDIKLHAENFLMPVTVLALACSDQDLPSNQTPLPPNQPSPQGMTKTPNWGLLRDLLSLGDSELDNYICPSIPVGDEKTTSTSVRNKLERRARENYSGDSPPSCRAGYSVVADIVMSSNPLPVWVRDGSTQLMLTGVPRHLAVPLVSALADSAQQRFGQVVMTFMRRHCLTSTDPEKMTGPVVAATRLHQPVHDACLTSRPLFQPSLATSCTIVVVYQLDPSRYLENGNSMARALKSWFTLLVDAQPNLSNQHFRFHHVHKGGDGMQVWRVPQSGQNHDWANKTRESLAASPKSAKLFGLADHQPTRLRWSGSNVVHAATHTSFFMLFAWSREIAVHLHNEIVQLFSNQNIRLIERAFAILPGSPAKKLMLK